MKKTKIGTSLLLSLCLILSGILCACGSAPAAQTAPPEPLAPELEAFREILEDGGTFRQESGESLDVSKIGLAMTPDAEIAALFRVKCFTVLDLDGDGPAEMVLKLANRNDDNTGCVILRHQDGQVLGTTMYNRTFDCLKQDGSFSFSGGASDYGFGRLRYGAQGWETVVLAQQYDDEAGPNYEVGGEPADAGAFLKFCDPLLAAEEVVWYDSWDTYLRYRDGAPGDHADALAAFEAVLTGDEVLFDTFRNCYQPYSQLLEYYGYFEPNITVEKLALADLDGDGSQELLFWLAKGTDSHYGYTVLRYHEGRVLGYECTYTYRTFGELKADGTFTLSYTADSGKSMQGFGRMAFTDTGTDIRPITESYELYDENGNVAGICYTLDGKQVSEKDYQEAEQTQRGKPNAVWYDTWEALAAAVS